MKVMGSSALRAVRYGRPWLLSQVQQSNYLIGKACCTLTLALQEVPQVYFVSVNSESSHSSQVQRHTLVAASV